MNPKYAHLFTKDGRVNTASIRSDRLNSELRAEIEQQYPIYTKLSHKLRAIKNGGYFHCYVCGAITEPSASVNREKLYCSKACVNACPDRISRAKALYQTHRDKRTKTNQERYGADTSFDSPSVQAKVKLTIQAKYGVSNIAQLDEVKRKKEQTYQERYGVRSPSQAEQFKVKAFNTMVERYGGHYIGSTTASTLAQAKFHYVSSLGIDCTECEVANITIGHFHAPISKEMILAKLGRIPMSVELVKRNYTHAYPILHQYKLMNSRAMSSQHKIVSAWLDELNIDYIANSRKVIAPQELDIFIPSHNLAIEINGHHWHDSNNGTNRTYHYDKTNKCLEQGIQLLHFWDYEIDNKPDLIKSIIKSKLGLNKRLYARKLKVNRVSNTQAKEFLNNNHLNGHTPAKHTLGLYDNDTLVMVLSYGSSRFEKDATEIIRIASSQGITVVGGVSKLLKHARLKGRIVSYADRRISNGNVYYELGFKYLHTTKYGYHYYDGKRCYSRQQCQKKRLNKLYGLDMSLTEQEMTKLLGYKMLCDAGHMKFELS